MLNKTYRILGLLLILTVGQLNATVTQSGSSDLEGYSGWLYDYSSLGEGDTTYLNNTVYKATFTFDLTANHNTYYIYLGTDDDEDGEFLDDTLGWGASIKSGFGTDETISTEAYYYTLDDHNADGSKDDKKLKFFVKRNSDNANYRDTLELSGIYEWHLASPQSPSTPDLDNDDDTGTSNTDNETNLSLIHI